MKEKQEVDYILISIILLFWVTATIQICNTGNG